jgi:hypothetical protein
MARRYDAFLVRHWALDGERGSRIEVVHVQSGDRALSTLPTQVVNWMQERVTGDGTGDLAPPADDEGNLSECSQASDTPVC